MKIHIVMHESFEAPAAIEKWAMSRNHELSYTRLFRGDKFPNTSDFDFLLVMGGPQSPATTLSECSYFDAKQETFFVKKAIDEGKVVFGVCLGAQFIGEALGAKFEHSPNREIGVFPITFTKESVGETHFSEFPNQFMVGHWHGDMPGLTPESKVIATSAGCPRQIVKYTSKVYGFQCHFEFTKEAIEAMISNCSHELIEYKNLPYIQSAELLRNYDYSDMNKLLFNFLDKLTTI